MAWPDGDNASWEDARDAARSGAPAVLPFGAFEQHGPHLPLSTDTAMAASWLVESPMGSTGSFFPLCHSVTRRAMTDFRGRCRCPSTPCVP